VNNVEVGRLFELKVEKRALLALATLKVGARALKPFPRCSKAQPLAPDTQGSWSLEGGIK
jgi:hypothetical protein